MKNKNSKKFGKKAEMSSLVKILMWAVFLALALAGLYFLINYLSNV